GTAGPTALRPLSRPATGNRCFAFARAGAASHNARSFVPGHAMHTLYYSPGAASMPVHWLLIELRIAHELSLVDFESRAQKSPGYLALNPSCVVPTLVVDGRPRTEAAALLVHLADAYPEARFSPPPGAPLRMDFLQWMFHLANVVQPLFRMWWYPHEPAGHD